MFYMFINLNFQLRFALNNYALFNLIFKTFGSTLCERRSSMIYQVFKSLDTNGTQAEQTIK